MRTRTDRLIDALARAGAPRVGGVRVRVRDGDGPHETGRVVVGETSAALLVGGGGWDGVDVAAAREALAMLGVPGEVAVDRGVLAIVVPGQMLDDDDGASFAAVAIVEAWRTARARPSPSPLAPGLAPLDALGDEA